MENQKYNDQLLSGVINGDFDKIVDALENGADIHQKTTKGNNLLYIAATRGQEDVFNEILEVEVKGRKIDLNTQNNMGATTLFELIREDGFTSYVAKLLEFGANPNIVANDGISPLILACSDKKIEDVELLLKAGADVNYKVPGTLTTPFLMAASQSSLTICELLRNAGADVNACDSFGKNALLTAIYKSEQFMKKREKAEHKSLLDYLVNIGIDVNYVAPSGMSALWAASLQRNPELVNQLLDKGANADVWHEIGLEGQMSALHLWMNTSEEEIIRKLVDNGAKLGEPDSNGNTPDALGFANPSLTDLMLDINADVNAVYHYPKQSKTDSNVAIPALSIIIRGGNNKVGVVKEMISRGAKTTYFGTDLESQEPLIAAISSSAYDIVDEIINSGSVNVNNLYNLNPNSPAMSPLSVLAGGALNSKISSHIAKKVQLQAILKGKEINDQNNIKSDLIDDEGINQIREELDSILKLEENIQNQRGKIFDSLFKAGANPNLLDERGRTSLFFANDEFSAIKLLENGADVNIKDTDGNNIFIYAVQHNKIPLFNTLREYCKPDLADIFYQLSFTDIDSSFSQQLLESGIISLVSPPEEFYKDKEYILPTDNINYQDEDGNSPLLVACANNAPFLVSLYRRLGADINLPNNLGETPLMHAVASTNPDLVDFLVERGALVDVKTIDNKSVLDFALETKNLEIIEKIKIKLGLLNSEGSLSGYRKVKP